MVKVGWVIELVVCCVVVDFVGVGWYCVVCVWYVGVVQFGIFGGLLGVFVCGDCCFVVVVVVGLYWFVDVGYGYWYFWYDFDYFCWWFCFWCGGGYDLFFDCVYVGFVDFVFGQLLCVWCWV